MLRCLPVVLAGVMLASPAKSAAQRGETSLEITLEHNSEAERATGDQLRRVVQQFDVRRWLYTRRIHIDEQAIPHSHPVLTLHTRYLRDDATLLATFLHEQFHWLEEDNPAFEAAMRGYTQAYPDAPARGPEGARDLQSTYRHLLVCDLEFQAASILFGQPRARELLAAKTYYTWIYARVLTDPHVREIAQTNGFVLDVVGEQSRGVRRPTIP